MLIIQDQREKHGHHNNIEEYCKQHDIPIIRKRLEVGDYMLGTIENGRVKPIGKRSVDVKSLGASELAKDLYQDKKSFNKKYKKCYSFNQTSTWKREKGKCQPRNNQQITRPYEHIIFKQNLSSNTK
jgi:hypothetical protein